jgi:hypothetical protein
MDMHILKLPLVLGAIGLAIGQAAGPTAAQQTVAQQTGAQQVRSAEADAAQRVAIAARIQREVAAIRGLRFKEPVKVVKRPAEEFQQRLDTRMQTILGGNAAI